MAAAGIDIHVEECNNIERVMDTEYVEPVFTDLSYYETLVLYRRNFIFKQGLDFDTHHPKAITFIPPTAIQNNYKKDYSQMKEQMIYGDNVQEFEVLISRLKELMSRIKAIKSSYSRYPKGSIMEAGRCYDRILFLQDAKNKCDEKL
jgi:hypothetical protein